jgi:hypothetical protein
MSVESSFYVIWICLMHLQDKCHEQDKAIDVYNYQQNTKKIENGFSGLSALDTK